MDLSIEDQSTAGTSAACRAVNLAVALIALVLVSPALLLIAVLVKLTSPGPVVYRQTRVGLDRRRPGSGREARASERDAGGRLFTILKFRTMRYCPPHEERQVWASHCDPRVTPLGRVLRRLRLDELPQLMNVLAGDMNIVGPRPEQPDIVRELRRRIDGYAHRHRVLPGITGLAQTTLGYDRTIDDVTRKLALDLEYVRRRSALRDLQIMARTPRVMIGMRGVR